MTDTSRAGWPASWGCICWAGGGGRDEGRRRERLELLGRCVG